MAHCRYILGFPWGEVSVVADDHRVVPVGHDELEAAFGAFLDIVEQRLFETLPPAQYVEIWPWQGYTRPLGQAQQLVEFVHDFGTRSSRHDFSLSDLSPVVSYTRFS